MQNFIYLITDIDSRQAAVVDPAWEPNKIIEYASANDIQITDILLTHSHHDHINGVEEVLNKYDSKLHLLKAEADFWQADLVKPELHYGGDTISIGQSSIQVLHTPGHTPGSTCYMLDGDLITGDTLFVFGCGRCDLHGGNPEEMYTTLKNLKSHLTSKTLILPGHNYSTKKTSTLKEQIEGNPFFHFNDLGKFVNYRMNRCI